FEQVDIEASLPGADIAWIKFLERNLKADVAVTHGAPAAIYTVWIQFIVDKEGIVSDIKTLTNSGYGMETEVARVLKKAPKWVPANQNGRIVKAYRKQPFTFQIEDADLQVMPDNSTVLYIGINNPVTITTTKGKEENLR